MDQARKIENGLRADIQRLRRAIRHHRDQKGDARCWLDDFPVWSEIGGPADPKILPPFEEGMAHCREFFLHRRAETADPIPHDAGRDPDAWDADLEGMSEDALRGELARLRDSIAAHRDVSGRPRTIGDDRALYEVLPERLPADFRLPPEGEFLGDDKPGTGCPAFWRSHGSCHCHEHDLHRWGPCC